MKQFGKSYGVQFVPLFLLSAVLMLSACWFKSGLNGTYAAHNSIAGDIAYTFKSNGKVTASFMNREFEGTYEVDGNKVRIKYPLRPDAGTEVFTLLEDGSLEGPGGIKFTKEKK